MTERSLEMIILRKSRITLTLVRLLTITPRDNGVLTGVTQVGAVQGVFTFTDLVFKAPPGTQGVIFQAVTDSIDNSIVNSALGQD